MGGRVLLLQESVYLPSFGGGNKSNRYLMTELAAQGFDCHVVSHVPGKRRFLTNHFSSEGLMARGVSLGTDRFGDMAYRHRGVDVHALEIDAPTTPARVAAHIAETAPDWILISDSRFVPFFEGALAHAPERTVAIVHTHSYLPFGPQGDKMDAAQHERLRQVGGIAAVSEFSRAYLRAHGGLESGLVRFPVYGPGPFPAPERPEDGYVLMINPCLTKGLPVFLALAACFAHERFAVVPSWGFSEAIAGELARHPNVTILDPHDDVGVVLRQARVLLAPSLVPETFGCVAIDAMLRSVPVLAGNLGGQPEAKLGTDFVLPVAPAERIDGDYVAPPQPVAAWREALGRLLSDAAFYRQSAAQARAAAHRFLPQTDVAHFIAYLESLRGVRDRDRPAPQPDRCLSGAP